MRPITDEEKERIWDMHEAGVPVKRIARTMGRQNCSMRELISRTGGMRTPPRILNERHLSLAEREETFEGPGRGVSLRWIAQRLRRAPSTICREVNANGGRRHYRALNAERVARRRAR